MKQNSQNSSAHETTSNAAPTKEKINSSLVKLTWAFRACLLIAVISIPAILFSIYGACYISATLSGVSCLLSLLFAYVTFSKRHSILKYSVVLQIISQYFKSSIYNASCKLSHDKLDDANIVDDWDSASVSDYFVGAWKDYPIEFGDLTLKGKNKVGKPIVLFSGQLYIIELKTDIKVPITIRERAELLTPEVYEARKSSDRFFVTSNETFDRQFEVKFGNPNRASGFEETHNGLSPEAQRTYVHSILDGMTADIIAADAYASSNTFMRFINNKLYIAIENSRDTFEFHIGDEKHIDLLRERLDEEARAMTSYLDFITQNLPNS